MEHLHFSPLARTILRDLGLPEGPLKPVESYSHAVWLTERHAVRIHVIGLAGRLQHEARVGARLPAEALYPRVLGVGRRDSRDWMVTERAPGVPLSEVWPSMTRRERREAVLQSAGALRAVHRAPATELVPRCLQGGAPTLSRRELLDRLLRAGVAEIEPLAGMFDCDPRVMAHGDFNPNQIIWFEGRVTALLDLEMSHAEAPDWDLGHFLGFCADPVRAVPLALEAATRPEDYAEVPGWLREAYPEMFAFPRLRDRLLLQALVFRSAELLERPDAAGEIIGASREEIRPLEALMPAARRVRAGGPASESAGHARRWVPRGSGPAAAT